MPWCSLKSTTKGKDRGADWKKQEAMTENQLKRLFIAVELPENARLRLGCLAQEVSGVKWNPAQQLHLTLRFIGDSSPDDQHKIENALQTVTGSPFEVTLSGLGVFPSTARPKVLWAGIEGGKAELVSLQQEIEYQLLEAGLKPQDKPFHPHVTLGRNRTAAANAIQNWLEHHRDFALEPFSVNSFALFSSKLTPQGAVHTKEVEYHLES